MLVQYNLVEVDEVNEVANRRQPLAPPVFATF